MGPDRSEHLRLLWDGEGAPVAANLFSQGTEAPEARCLAQDARGLICLGIEENGVGQLTPEGERYAEEKGLGKSFLAVLKASANKDDVIQAMRDKRAMWAFQQTLMERHGSRTPHENWLGVPQGADTARNLVVQIPPQTKPQPVKKLS
jgi:hypothetical protein